MPRDLFAEAGINPYDDSDQQSAPRDLFAEAGINPNEDKQSALERFANSGLGQEIIGAGDSARGAIDSIVNLPAQALNLALPKNMQLQLLKGGDSPGYNAGHMAGDVAGFLGGGEALDSTRQAAEAAPYVGKLAQALGGGGLSGVGRRALGSGLYGAIENPDNQGKGAAEMAGLSAALDMAFGLPGVLLPSFRGTATPEQIAKNLEVTRGTNTNLAEIMNDPTWKRKFENTFPSIAGSNSADVMGKIADQVKQQGEDIYGRMSQGMDKQNLKPAIVDALGKAYDDAMKMKRQNYQDLDNLASSYGLNIKTPSFQSTASDILDTVKESPRLMEEMDSSLLNKLQNYANPYDAEKLKSTNVFKGLLGDKAREAFRNGKDYEGGIYNNLKNALEGDVNNAFENTGDPLLKSKYQAAQNFYKENIVPFEDPDVEKFVRQGGDPDMILSTFIKKGQNDRANLLGKLMDKLPADQKNLVPAAYFSSALKDGKIDPLAMKTLYNSLGQGQRETLLGSELNNRMGNYSKLVSMNAEPLTAMVNPKTGQRNLGFNALMPHALGALAGGLGGSYVDGPGGTATGILTGLIAPAAYASVMNKMLTSPKVREMVTNSAMKGGSGIAKNLGIGSGNYRDALKAALASAYLNQ